MWPPGLNCLLVPQERLLQANLGEMRCAMPRQPPEQVRGTVLGVASSPELKSGLPVSGPGSGVLGRGPWAWWAA